MYISGINFLSEITEWMSNVLATWSLLSTYTCIFFLTFFPWAVNLSPPQVLPQDFEDYPKSQKTLIPFIFQGNQIKREHSSIDPVENHKAAETVTFTVPLHICKSWPLEFGQLT